MLNGFLLLLRPKWRAVAKQERRPYIIGSFCVALMLAFVSAIAMEGYEASYVVLFGGGGIIYLINRWLLKDSAETEEDNLFV